MAGALSAWQSPPFALVEPLLNALRWLDRWFGDSSWMHGTSSWTEDNQLAVMWRHGSLLAQVCAGMCSEVRAWRLLLREVKWAFVCVPFMIVDETVRSICSGCPNLTSLDLGKTCITDAALHEVARCCPRLQTLNLSGSQQFSDAGLSAVAASCAKLRSLHLNLPLASFTSMALRNLSRLASLTRLNLTGAEWLSDAGVRELAACEWLEELWLSTCSGVRDGGLCAIASSCQRLRLIDISNCTRVSDEGASSLTALPHLSHFELAGCAGVADGTLEALAQQQSCVRGQRPPRLTHLGLSSRNGRSAISESGLLAVAPACASLTYLNLARCCAAVTDRALAALSAHATCLRVLDLSRCDECTAEGLIEVCRHCPHLEQLNLEGCDALTPDAGLAIASLSSLRSLGTHMAWLLRPNVLDGTWPAGQEPTAEAMRVGQRVRAALPQCLIYSGTWSPTGGWDS